MYTFSEWKKEKEEKYNYENWDEMVKWFEKRTNRHIELVSKYCKKLVEYDEDRFGELLERIKIHDDSKFEEPEKTPYVVITWSYKCKDDGVEFEVKETLKDDLNKATLHHVLNNRHHPEFHDKENAKINDKDRDAKVEGSIVNASKMNDIDIAEMVCDWAAVGEERKNTVRSWADKNIDVRWKFTDKQIKLINELIKVVEKTS